MKFRTYLLVPLCAATLAACGGDNDDDATAATPPTATSPAATGATPTIASVAGTSGFNALLAAATKADLAATLSNPDARLTVFAPTDAAFNQLATTLGFASAAAMVDALPAESLRRLLSYHVLQGAKQSSDLGTSSQATLLEFEGRPAAVAVNAAATGLGLTDAVLGTASVTTPNVAAGNSVIHAIDKVLVPPGVFTIVQMAQLNPALSSLVTAVVSANLQGTLSGAGPFTVFAPTNDAFAAAPAGLTTQQLTTVLTYHALGTQVLASQIPFGTQVGTLATQPITINAGTPPTITDRTAIPARILATDVRASNGVIHLIDKVLIPAL